MYFLVTPQVLSEQAGQISVCIRNAKEAADGIRQVMNKTHMYWLGEAADIHRSAYKEKEEKGLLLLTHMDGHVQKLLMMAGVYQTTEDTAIQEAAALPDDVIS